MKRKRGAGKRKSNKPSTGGAGEVFVEPGYYSDRNEENDELESRTEIETRAVHTKLYGQHVIKKIMKMEAAAPFNAPVDPIALGIPDYFDIIDTPMDFGTICSKLESGLKYRNSEEVFKDVGLIWDNCCKYNKKGSLILELMKRVKTNFKRQWTAAGLHREQSTLTTGKNGLCSCWCCY
ncbi:UNVERIFIED_CONTAM: Bromodomain-containing factor 2 [Sesamum radiatum]|uniref:Bromodomain-containing factor 2 n=1 Tax=Sesamum radiatum TaxID=300843 RepID=A0AAW2RWU3_SESRA